MRILLVEDDSSVAAGIEAGLSLHGFIVDSVSTLSHAELALRTSRPSACVLDLSLPDGDGMALLARWRTRRERLPILVLTARDAVAHRVQALRTGADDYVLKPFDLDELEARLHALIRRAAGHSADDISHGSLKVSLSSGEVTLSGKPVILSRREFGLLKVMLQHPGHVLTADQLRDNLYGSANRAESNAVNVHIHKLRRKLGSSVIETVRGMGYRLGSTLL